MGEEVKKKRGGMMEECWVNVGGWILVFVRGNERWWFME